MSGLKSKYPDGGAPRPIDPGCLVTQDVPAVCLRLRSHRQQLALPYALLLQIELSDDQANCVIVFATHAISVRGRHLREVFVAISQGQAAQISVGESALVGEGAVFVGPLVTDIRIEPTDESGQSRR